MSMCLVLTFSHGFDSDDLAGISAACGSDGHHPDAVLSVPAQVRDAVKENIWSCFKFTAHLQEEGGGKKTKHLKHAELVANPICSPALNKPSTETEMTEQESWWNQFYRRVWIGAENCVFPDDAVHFERRKPRHKHH